MEAGRQCSEELLSKSIIHIGALTRSISGTLVAIPFKYHCNMEPLLRILTIRGRWGGAGYLLFHHPSPPSLEVPAKSIFHVHNNCVQWLYCVGSKNRILSRKSEGLFWISIEVELFGRLCSSSEIIPLIPTKFWSFQKWYQMGRIWKIFQIMPILYHFVPNFSSNRHGQRCPPPNKQADRSFHDGTSRYIFIVYEYRIAPNFVTLHCTSVWSDFGWQAISL